MWISQLMRGMIGEARPDQAKALELRVGQIVRGVVLQLLDGQDALVSLSGVQLRARLETSLAPGQSALLQVMPESNDGSIVLRAVPNGTVPLSEAALRELMRLLGLPDKRWAADLALDLRRGGYPLTRETGEALKQAAALRPAGVPEAEWMQAAATAWKRGLPLTEGSIAALRQVMFGMPAGELLAALRSQLTALAGRGAAGSPAAGGAAGSGGLPVEAARVLALLQEGEALLAGPMGRGIASQNGVAGAAGQTAADGLTGAAVQTSGRAASPAGQTAPQIGPSANPAGTGSGLALSAGVNVQAGNAGSSASMSGAAAAAQGDAAASAGRTDGLAGMAAARPEGAAGSAGAAGHGGTAAQPSGGNWIHGLLKWLGVDYERQLSRLAGARHDQGDSRLDGAGQRMPETSSSAADGRGAVDAGRAGTSVPAGPGAADRMMPPRTMMPIVQQADLPPAAAGSPASASAAGEPLKQALLSLIASDDVPAALRETAQQLVQHITGQQLLLTPERGGALFSHMTLFIPFQGEDGGTTAQVTIQSRRGRKGDLDPDNCRLLFDLHMRHLGDTLVDVQVVDRIVSLNLWNDHPSIAGLLDASRDEAAEALGRAGYQLLTMTAKPFPDTVRRRAESEAAAHQQAAPPLPDIEAYAAKPYRGVDYRA